MSFNKNNPNAMGKIVGYLKQISTEMVSEFLKTIVIYFISTNLLGCLFNSSK